MVLFISEPGFQTQTITQVLAAFISAVSKGAWAVDNKAHFLTSLAFKITAGYVVAWSLRLRNGCLLSMLSWICGLQRESSISLYISFYFLGEMIQRSFCKKIRFVHSGLLWRRRQEPFDRHYHRWGGSIKGSRRPISLLSECTGLTYLPNSFASASVL